MKNILIVDEHPGFIFWLGEALVSSNYQAWPACSAFDAMSLAGRKRSMPLDVLIVNPSLPNAADLITQLRRRNANLKVLAIGSHSENFVVPGVNLWRERPNPNDLSAKIKWVRAIERMFGRQKRAAA